MSQLKFCKSCKPSLSLTVRQSLKTFQQQFFQSFSNNQGQIYFIFFRIVYIFIDDYMLYILTSAWSLRSLFACQNMLFCRFSKFLHHLEGTKNDPLTYKKGKNATFLPKSGPTHCDNCLKINKKKV